MKTRTIYTCEICGWDHHTEESARQCESRGRPVAYPIGLIHGSATGFYKGITFAVAINRCDEGHSNEGALWACRDNGAGDSRNIKDICGGQSIRIGSHDVPNPNAASFKRMVALLRNFGIESITCWDGTKPVPLSEFLKGTK